jgi:hypothetical protein
MVQAHRSILNILTQNEKASGVGWEIFLFKNPTLIFLSLQHYTILKFLCIFSEKFMHGIKYF